MNKSMKLAIAKKGLLALAVATGFSLVACAQSDDRRGPPPSPDEIISQLDTNQDGSISEDEAKGPLADHFSEVDTDGNGLISEDELEAAMQHAPQK